jgi:hypothetical protein
VLYLDSVDIGVWNLEHEEMPRLKFFNGGRMRSMILADSRTTPGNYSQRHFGKSKVSKQQKIV